MYILPDPHFLSIMHRCTLYAPGLQDEGLQVTIQNVGFFNLHRG